MESSRRPPLDSKSGELGLKRQRVAAGANLSSRPSVAASSRLRSNGRGKDSDGLSNDPVRGPLPEPPLHHHRELVSQYKTALSELIFNSKPIITNLTIIAGENSHAAKAVAATICAHILEVPSDQKLPSLYLLDSIVKNIGRDYVKHFAPRLPEVFIKVYRHADPSIHPAMRHLFGTWKGVFPLQSLQLIDKELGLSPAANGSLSGSTTSMADSQSQHQPHSIHVNPRYLEERQRLQQSSRPKGSANNVADAYITSTAEVERPDKTASVGAEISWRDGSNKSVLRPRRELKNNLPEKLSSAKSEDLDYSTGLARPLSSRLGKVNASIPEQAYNKRWFSGKRDVKESITSPGNGYDSRLGTPNYSASRSASVPSGADMSRSWKNSEEEEFSWDDLNPSLVDHAAANSMREEHWDIEDLDNLEFERESQPEAGPMNEREIVNDIITGEQRELVTFEQQRSSPWPLCDQSFAQSSDLSLHKKGLQSLRGPSQAISSSLGLSSSDVSESAGSIVQRHQSTGKPLIQPYLSTSSFSARDPRLMFAEKEHVPSKQPQADHKISALSGQLGLGVRDKKIQNSVAADPNLLLERVRNFEPQTTRKKTPVTASLQSRHLGLVSPELPRSRTQAESQVPQPSASTLLAAVMKSGILSTLRPSLSYDPSQSTLPSPEYGGSSSSSTPCVDPKSQGPALVVPGPPSLQSSSTNQSSNHTGPSSNPFSSLLNTLMAKGLISTTESEDATRSRSDSSRKPSETRPVLGTLKCVKASTVSDSSPSVTLSATGKVTSTKSSGQIRETSSEMKTRAAGNLIGLEFKSHVLREFHSEVVDGIFVEDHPHCCGICGVRLKLKERFERHMEWHSMKTSSEQGKSNVPWRRWYANSEDWIAGNVGLPMCCDPAAGSLGESCEATGKEEIEPMVAADERQCVCLLCGELFEDIYSEEEEEWMFKGAVNMKVCFVSGGKECVADQNSGQGVIVHGKCASDYADRDLGLPDGVKLEEGV